MDRRKFIRLAAAGAAASAIRSNPALCGEPAAQTRAQRKPNVLFIAVDDMNDWTEGLGGYAGKVHTPNQDRLAKRGVLFTNAHCPSPVCNPSRTAILTGLQPSTTGIYNNGHWWRPHLPDAVTIPQHFMAHGYRVVGGGKIFHHTPGFNPPDQWHRYFNQVFDDAFHRPKGNAIAAPAGVHWPKGFPLNEIENVRFGRRPPSNAKEFDWGPFDKGDLLMGDGRMVAWAVDFLKQSYDEPFFLAAGIFRPHLPWYIPRKYFDMYSEDRIVLPKVPDNDLNDIPAAGRRMAEARRADFELVKQSGKWREAIRAYLASITFADALVGRLLDALETGPHADHTIIVFWSDHGWHLGEKHHWHKMTLWEEATRVPFIVVAPGVTRPGTRCSRPVGLIDVYPTLIDLCNLTPKSELDGRSLTLLLQNPRAQWDRPALTTYLRGNHAARSERWRYIHYADGSEELYDHKNDPNEWANLASEPKYAAVKRDLARRLPRRDAPDAPTKRAYTFDGQKYRWSKAK